MDHNLVQGASQSLEQTHVLSPQHLQALKALQAPLMELSGSFAEVLAENPLITTEDDEDFEDEPEQETGTDDLPTMTDARTYSLRFHLRRARRSMQAPFRESAGV